MKPSRSARTRYVFRVRCKPAQQVRLVIERRGGVSQAFALEPRDPGAWETALDLEPGEYRYCYHAYTGRRLTYLTPPDAPLDGLKAVLRVEAEGTPTEESEPARPMSAAHEALAAPA